MDASAREKETKLLGAIADFDGRIKRGIEAIKATESVERAVAGLNLGGNRAGGVDALADAEKELRALQLGQGADFAPGNAAETRTDNTTTGASVIPRTLFGQLLAEMVNRSTVMRGGASTFTTSGGEPLDFSVVVGRASASIVGEAQPIGESTGATVIRSMGAYKYGYASTFSSELLQDQKLDLVGFLVGDAGPALGAGMGLHFLTGTGTGQPKGIITAASPATATFLATAKDATVSDALIDLFYELQPQYRGGASFVVADKTAAQMRKLKDGMGQYLWQSAVTVGAPDTFNGRPVLTDVGVPDDKVLFADLSKYRIRFAGPLRVERSLDVAFKTDQIVYRFIQRADGLLVDELSAKVLTVGGGA
jgi:HK97 family phage major capsid protein